MSVLKMSEATSIAIHTLILLAMNKNRMRSSKEIAAILGVSEGHLSKILQILVKSEFLESIRGPKGGFKLRKDDRQLRLLDVYKLVEGNINSKKCSFQADVCKKVCIIDKIEKPIYDLFLSVYGNTSIYDIISKNWI